MKNHFLIYVLLIFTLSSCNNECGQLNEINSFLQSNYEFSNHVLKKNRKEYYNLIHDRPSLEIKKINELDTQLNLLIFKIDNAILNNEIITKNIIVESNQILRELKKIIKYSKDYTFQKFEKPKTNSNRFTLNYLKNKLAIAMATGFEYANGYTKTGLVLPKGIDSIITSKTKNGMKLTLNSKVGQLIKENGEIVIKSIKFNGQEKKIYFKLKNNDAFADIEFDSLQSGSYEITGVLEFYDRNRKVQSQFTREFEVE